MSRITGFLRKTFAAVLAASLIGCASVDVRNDPELQAARRGPGNAPQRNVTDFTPALRCMDDLLYAYGVRDVVILVEDMQDSTHRLGAGTRDMMVSAVSDMTRRSRAVRLVTFGQDNQTVVNLLQQLEKRTAYGVLPQFDIRGSVTQFDEDVLRRQASLGVSVAQVGGLKIGKAAQASVLGFDASVVSVPDLALVPGVTSKNTVVVLRDESGVGDGVATIRKVGVTFDMNVSRAGGTAQALRNMVELATVELVGKLVRVPYWSCIGLDTEHPEVRREVEDWFFSMRADGERNRFFQEQLRFRKFFDGPLDGRSTPALEGALQAYKTALGFSATTPTDVNFFAQFLVRPLPAPPAQPFAVPEGARLVAAAPAASSSDASSALASTASPGELELVALKPGVRVGEEIEIAVTSPRAGYLYCYAQPQGGAIQRIFPNRNVRDPRIDAGDTVLLPGGQAFRITADKPGQHRLACMVAAREVYNDLPPPLRWGDFEDVKLKTFAEIKAAFETAGKLPVKLAETTIAVN